MPKREGETPKGLPSTAVIEMMRAGISVLKGGLHMYGKILVPVDGSDTALKGLNEAIKIAVSGHRRRIECE
jgi:hypothetical protein